MKDDNFIIFESIIILLVGVVLSMISCIGGYFIMFNLTGSLFKSLLFGGFMSAYQMFFITGLVLLVLIIEAKRKHEARSNKK